MIQTSPLVWGMAAALASTHTSASTSYPGVPIDLSSSLPTALCLAKEPPKGLSFGAKGKTSFLLDLTSLPPTQHSRRNRPGEPPPHASPRLPTAYDGFAGRGQETPTQTPKAGREAAAGDQGQKKPWAALNPWSKTPNSQLLCPLRAPSRGRCPMSCWSPTSSTKRLSPAWTCRQELPWGPAGRSCPILFFRKGLGRSITFPCPAPREKKCF